MMKFDRDSKVNFVDKNNVVVGFDLSEICCEDFGYYFVDHILDTILDVSPPEPDLTNYIFDPTFFQQRGDENSSQPSMIAYFKITDGENIKFLALHNTHNGYYSHGFSIEVNGQVVKEGYL